MIRAGLSTERIIYAQHKKILDKLEKRTNTGDEFNWGKNLGWGEPNDNTSTTHMR
jgi:hypothetical protein